MELDWTDSGWGELVGEICERGTGSWPGPTVFVGTGGWELL